MSYSVGAVLYIKCISVKQCKILKKYLHEKSRPKFDELVSEEEQHYVEPFEFLENPDTLKIIKKKDLLVEFHPDDTDFSEEARELIEVLLNIVGVESIVYCELCYEFWTKFEFHTKGKQQLLWEVELFEKIIDKKKSNRFLSDEEKKEYGRILLDDEQGAEKVVLAISEKLEY